MAINLFQAVLVEEIKTIAALTNDARADLAARINATDPFTIFDSVEGKTDEIICPVCGSGTHGNKNTGIKPTFENGKWLYHCFAQQDFEGDLIKIIADVNKLSTRGKDFFEVLAIAAKITNQNIFIPSASDERASTINFENSKKGKSQMKNQEKSTPVFERLAQAQNNLPAFIEKQGGKWRGLTLETLQRINCGFLPAISFNADNGEKIKLPAVVIPNDLGNVYFRATEGKHHKNIGKTATTTIFIPDSNKFNLIVTEGQINALSIFQAVQDVTNDLPDFGIMACSGTSGEKAISAKIQQLTDNGKKIRVLIAFDNDSEEKNGQAGQKAADNLVKKLLKNGYPVCIVDITKIPDVDCNDVLQKNGGEFELFDMISNVLSDVITLEEPEINSDLQTESESQKNNFGGMHEVTHSDDDDTPRKDPFEEELEKVKADILDNPEINKFIVPLPYVVTNHGIKKIGKKDITKICPRVVLIKDKFFNLDDKTYKLTLEHLTARKIWKVIPPQKNSVIFHKNRIIDLVDYDLPVDSSSGSKLVEYLHALYFANETYIPLTFCVNRCGWRTYKDKDYFVDPRIDNKVTDEETGKQINLIVDPDSPFAKNLTTSGSLEEWKRAYICAQNSTVARFTVAASVAAPLLKIFDERNFVVYIHGKTRGGKSTSLFLAASAVGNSELVRVFDATNNGLTAMAAETNHYPFFVDEKQAADPKLKSDYQRWIYSDANGIERTRANKDGTVKPARTWRHITICNGETVLLNDNSTGGAFTRILQIAAPDVIIEPDDCKFIRDIISKNHGHAYPIFIAQLKKEDIDELKNKYKVYQVILAEKCKERNINLLPDYLRYIALIIVADDILTRALNLTSNFDVDALLNALPTVEDTDDTAREFNAVLGFISEKAAHFVASEFFNKDRGLDIYGRSNASENFTFLTISALKIFCKDKNFDYDKVVTDCIKRGFFVPDDKIRGNRKSALNTVVKKLSKDFTANCYQIPNKFIYENNDSEINS